MKELKINLKAVKTKLTDFIKKETSNRGFKRVVLGVSGGVDSACVAYLAKAALGADNVLGIIMPYKTTTESDIADAKTVVKTLGIKSDYIDITDMVEAYFKKVNLSDKVRRGNKMARERMSILYDSSAEFNALVAGTSNKTEILLGYGTLYGDVACAINSIGSLYKTQVRQLSEFLGVPPNIISKPPTAGLWHGQTDEEELGFKYKDVDALLYYLVDKKFTTAQLVKKGFSKNFIDTVK
ncbi:MAG: NAD+ synthase, partial [Candidatus Omnitrophica bacterium]|nr:NAD+ synthase [Candidatus Omnitrophota bacterium]